jgi:hypothetical protein
MTKVALYARVASSRQNENDDRIKEQLRACREYMNVLSRAKPPNPNEGPDSCCQISQYHLVI